MDRSGWSRRRLVRVVFATVVLALLVPGAASALAYQPGAYADLGPGTVTSNATGETVVGVQGFHYAGWGNQKKPARLVGVSPNGTTEWVYDGRTHRTAWFYDVDPLEGGTLLVTSIREGETLVYELDPETRERLWVRRFNIEDTHDVDMLDDHRLVVANMRHWDAERGVSDDRVFVYDLRTDEVTWEWTVRRHYPNETDGGFREDWTHVNDVDPVGEDGLLISLRNFDQVVLVNRTTGEVEWRLGSDDGSTLREQHNPDYLESENGTPTLLVADSGNDRVVEFARRDGEWERTWVLRGDLNWPRDADRLPNGNTLIVDSLNHRLVEVTPRGRVVWEYYATWGPYDAERVAHGGGSHGPTMADLNATGTYTLTGGSGPARRGGLPPSEFVAQATAGTLLAAPGYALANRYAHLAPWFRPVWVSKWGFALALLAVPVVAVWGAVELSLARHRLGAAVRALCRRW